MFVVQLSSIYRVHDKVFYKNFLQNTVIFRSENIPVTQILEHSKDARKRASAATILFDLIHMNTFQVLLHIWMYHIINKLCNTFLYSLVRTINTKC